MGEYFKPWRRKIGVVTLVVALLFAVLWVQSLSVVHVIKPTRGASEIQELYLSRLGLTCITFRNVDQFPEPFVDPNPPFYETWDAHNGWVSENTPNHWKNCRIHSEWRLCGFSYAEGIGTYSNGPVIIWDIPFWPIVIPLTLLSTRLLLSKSRSGKSVPATELHAT